MKKATKMTVLVMVIICMMVGMTALAGAATTGMEDGIWAATSEPLGEGEYPPTFRLNVVVTDGKVDSIDFAYYAGQHKYQRAFLAYAKSEESKAAMSALLDEQEYYMAELNKTKDATKIKEFSKPAKSEDGKDIEMYEHLQKLWKDVVAQAGGKITDDAPSATTSNPKTGDSGMLLYMAIAGVALAGMLILRGKKANA